MIIFILFNNYIQCGQEAYRQQANRGSYPATGKIAS